MCKVIFKLAVPIENRTHCLHCSVRCQEEEEGEQRVNRVEFLLSSTTFSACKKNSVKNKQPNSRSNRIESKRKNRVQRGKQKQRKIKTAKSIRGTREGKHTSTTRGRVLLLSSINKPEEDVVVEGRREREKASTDENEEELNRNI